MFAEHIQDIPENAFSSLHVVSENIIRNIQGLSGKVLIALQEDQIVGLFHRQLQCISQDNIGILDYQLLPVGSEEKEVMTTVFMVLLPNHVLVTARCPVSPISFVLHAR